MSVHDPGLDPARDAVHPDPAQEDPVPTSARPTKIPHLVMALLFLGTAAVWALVVTGSLPPAALPYAFPGLLVLAGVIGLAAVVLGNRRRHDRSAEEKLDPLTGGWSDEDRQTVPLHRPEEYR